VYGIRVTVNEAEYAVVAAEAVMRGTLLELLLHGGVVQRIQPSALEMPSLDSREIAAYLYREGIIEHIPTSETESDETAAERKRLAHLFGQGKPISEMVIEDRGPR